MCLSPILIKNVRKEKHRRTPFFENYIEVPCGKCVECLKAKISERLCTLYMEFIERGYYAVFVTLTLDDSLFLKDMSGVKREHVKSLLDEMRKHKELSYFLTSEYGSTTDRPHYHMIAFGFMNLKQAEDFFLKHWSNGMISVTEVNDARFTYVSSCHITKCSHIPEYVDFSTGEYRRCNKPFTISSRGLGYSYARKHASQLYRDGVFYYKGQPFHLSVGIKTLLARIHYKSKFVTSTHFRLRERCVTAYADKGVFDRFSKYLADSSEDVIKHTMDPSEFAMNISDALVHSLNKFNLNYVNKSTTNQKV